MDKEHKCPWCHKPIKDFNDFDYLPYCNWEHAEKGADFNREERDMRDGCNAG